MANAALADHDENQELYRVEDMVITTAHKPFPNTTKGAPSFDISREDMAKNNMLTAEDAIKTAPGVQTRRRFVGDTNALVSIRGANSQQPGDVNVLVDGIPIANHVEARWNGAPKWGLIIPNSVDSATVFYGPYAAEHSGAFGGTIQMRTALPDNFEMHMDVMGIIQDSNVLEANDVLYGHKEYISAGNRFGDFSIMGFFNHLENQGQVQQIDWETRAAGSDGTSVTGAVFGTDETGLLRAYGGDYGIQNNITDLYEIKMGYDLTPDLRALLTVAYEEVSKEQQARTWLKDSSGADYWADNTLVNQGGYDWTANKPSWGAKKMVGQSQETQTMMYGLNVSGELTDNWDIDTTASFFDRFKDQTVKSWYSQNNPAYASDKSGRIEEKDVWWFDGSLKLATQSLFGNDDLGFMAGYQYNRSFLDFDRWASDNVVALEKTTKKGSKSYSGSTGFHAGFMQSDWDFAEGWNLMAGVRYDYWQTFNGYSDDSTPLNDRQLGRASPKASLAFSPTADWELRYSFSKAYRFPTAEELFLTSDSATGTVQADSNLKPSNGHFHDFQIHNELDGGYARASFFFNEINDEIGVAALKTSSGGSSSNVVNFDRTLTIGAAFDYGQDYILDLPIGLNANVTWINKEVKAYSSDSTYIGQEWVRTPKWRANGTLTYHATPEWDNSVVIQYRSKPNKYSNQSNQYSNELGNRVFWSMTSYVLTHIKSSYKMDLGDGQTGRFTFGIDNLLDGKNYDSHPYPSRTYYASVGVDID